MKLKDLETLKTGDTIYSFRDNIDEYLINESF